MKKAYIEQFLIGFLLIFATISFVATYSDEYDTRNKLYNLKAIALQTGKTMAKAYEQTMDMCFSKKVAQEILSESALGRELLQLSKDNKITFSYEFYDFEPKNPDGSIGDNEPDTVRIIIDNYSYKTFWYKFFDNEAFAFKKITKDFPIESPGSVTIRFDKPSARFENILGTYQLDKNNCITNVEMHMANSRNSTKWGRIDSDGKKVPIVSFASPPTYVFTIQDGNKKFKRPKDISAIELMKPHCFGTSSFPKLKINNTIVQAKTDNYRTGNVFFQHQELNPNTAEHIVVIPKSILNNYKYFISNIYKRGNERNKYEAFRKYADLLNSDNNPTNDINYRTDPNNEYKYAFDFDRSARDIDFLSMILDGEKKILPNIINNYTINKYTRQIKFLKDSCSKPRNYPPILNLNGCPVSILEDTTTNKIGWTAIDPDGQIVYKQADANNGNVTMNNNGTITYTPYANFYGTDKITVLVKDDDDAVTKKECRINIQEVNDPPTISGKPPSLVYAGSTFDFTPTANDVDGDVLTFSIKNKPSWLNFSTTTGRLYGTPNLSHLKQYSNIVITVSDNRGGTASITPVFEVINPAPDKRLIPIQAAKRHKAYVFNVKRYFSDSRGRNLIFSLSGRRPAGMRIEPLTGVITAWIGYSAEKKYDIRVNVSNGIASVSTKFRLKIIEKCGPYVNSFNSNGHDFWTGGVPYNHNYVIYSKWNKRATGYIWREYDFGFDCKNTKMRVSFQYKTSSALDAIKVYSNKYSRPIKIYRGTRNRWIKKTFELHTNRAGKLYLGIEARTRTRASVDTIVVEEI